MAESPSCFVVRCLRARPTQRIIRRLCSAPMVLLGLWCNSMFLRITAPERFGTVTAASVSETICSYLRYLDPSCSWLLRSWSQHRSSIQIPFPLPTRIVHALTRQVTLMQHMATIDVVWHTHSCLICLAALALFHRCRSVSRPLCPEVFSVQRGASTCVLPRKALVQYPRRAGLLARQ